MYFTFIEVCHIIIVCHYDKICIIIYVYNIVIVYSMYNCNTVDLIPKPSVK